mgnify:CR=1 FL=1
MIFCFCIQSVTKLSVYHGSHWLIVTQFHKFFLGKNKTTSSNSYHNSTNWKWVYIKYKKFNHVSDALPGFGLFIRLMKNFQLSRSFPRVQGRKAWKKISNYQKFLRNSRSSINHLNWYMEYYFCLLSLTIFWIKFPLTRLECFQWSPLVSPSLPLFLIKMKSLNLDIGKVLQTKNKFLFKASKVVEEGKSVGLEEGGATNWARWSWRDCC